METSGDRESRVTPRGRALAMPPAASQGGALPPPGPVKGVTMNLAHSSGLRCAPSSPGSTPALGPSFFG